jgi:hypothetical protein
MIEFKRDPSAVKDYGFDWASWLSSGDTISTSVWSAGACTVTSAAIVNSSTTMAFISGGTVDETYRVTNRITTAQGRVEEMSFSMPVINL